MSAARKAQDDHCHVGGVIRVTECNGCWWLNV